MSEPWEQAVETKYGRVRWELASDPIGSRLCYLMMSEQDGGPAVLVGYMTVEDPSTVDEETRRPSDPHDRRIDTVWVHPAARRCGIGHALGLIARQHRLFESHSDVRTAGGTVWAESLGDSVSEVHEQPDEEVFDCGAQSYYRVLLSAYPHLQGLEDEGF